MKIRIQNYQRHVDSVLEVKVGVTSIIGKSDHGKTSISRAISWFKFDRPLGTAFIRKGHSKTSVSINNIEHVRTKAKNYYLLDGEPIDPKKAQSLINIESINIQEQHDPPFLLKESSGEVARKLALLIDLTKPQDILRNLKSSGSKLESKRSALISLKNNLEEQHSKYAMLFRYKRGLLRIESRMASIEKQQQAMATLAAAIETATQAKLRLDTMPDTKAFEALITGLLKRLEKVHEEYKTAEVLNVAIVSVTEKEKARMPDLSYLKEAGENVIQNVSIQLTVVKMADKVGDILKKTRKMNVCLSRGTSLVGMLPHLETQKDHIATVQSLDKVLGTLRTLRLDVSSATKEVAEKQNELDELRASIDVCPFCGR